MSHSADPSTENPVTVRFETLTARHNVAPFDCNNLTLTKWLRDEALPAMISGTHTTYVALEEETGEEAVVGYVTLQAAFILYPPRKPGGHYRHIVPVVEIAKLGRDRNWRYRKLGVRLVLEGLRVALDVQDAIGGMAGVQLTTTDKGRHLYTQGPILFEPHPAANSKADFYMPMQDVRSLIRVS